MSRLDLSTYSYELNDTYQKVIDKKSDINWALFGLHKGENILKVSATGG